MKRPTKSELERRLASLGPEKRRLLELRLAREGLAEREEDSADDLAAALPAVGDAPEAAAGPPRPMALGLFFFSADGSSEGDRYRLLFDAARLADREGFVAVWTPERHFQDFGGLYPNPSVLGAALAVATERVAIRAGSVVLPLHHPVRVAEEWAVVDNLSRGRAAIACASGWHPADFVLRPGYADRKEEMYRAIDTLRRLWAGEAVAFPGESGEVEVRTLPRPVQAELPLWITSAGSAATWERAATIGGNLLASIGSQSFAELAERIGRYREARRRAGHDPAAGVVTVMLHTFLGTDREAVKATVRAPMIDYLRTHMKQFDNFMQLDGITDADREALLPLAFEHYVRQASLLGTPEDASRMINRLAAAGVDEIACLVDFGLPHEEVMASLELLAEVRRAHATATALELAR